MSLASNLSPVSVGSVSTMVVGSKGMVGGVGEGSRVDKGGVSLGLPLAQAVLDHGAGADSEGATIGVLLGVQGGGAEKSGDFMYSSLEITIISSNSLVTSNGNRHSGSGGDHGASAGAEAHVSAALLLLDSEGGHQPGDLVHGPGQVAVGAGHGLVASDRDGDGVTSDHGGGGSIAEAVGGVGILGGGGGEATGGCQQQERTHFPDCSS